MSTINTLVRTLLGIRDNNSNIVNCYGGAKEEEDMDENPSQDAFELGQLDLMAPNNKYKWYFDREINLDILGQENKIEDLQESLEGQRAYCKTMMVLSDDGKWVKDDSMKAKWAFAKGMSMKDDLEHKIKQLDKSFGSIDDDIVFNDKRTKGEVLVEYCTDLAESMHLKSKMDLGKLAIGVDVVQEMFGQKEILFEEYRRAMLVLAGVLAQNTGDYEIPRHNIYSVTYTTIHNPGWGQLFERVMGFDEPITEMPSYDDRFFGQVAIDMEGTIDLMQEVRDLTMITYGSNCPLLMRVIYDDLVEEREKNVLEGRDFLPQEDIDQMVSVFR